MHWQTPNLIGGIVFSVTMILLYLSSTLYHALPQGRVKRVFLKIDYAAIYLFIAGSYTPFALGALHGPWGWSLLGVIWFLAGLGISLKVFDLLPYPWVSTGLYLAMGWLVLVAAVPLAKNVPLPGIMWLVAGGIAYTVGVAFFVLDHRFRYSHAIWHTFVASGTGCHVIAVIGYSGVS
jgi:hemolysin III